MALAIKPAKQQGNAENIIQGFDVKYNFEHEIGEKPDFVRGKATKQGESNTHEVILYPGTNMVIINITNMGEAIESTLVNSMIEDLRSLNDGI